MTTNINDKQKFIDTLKGEDILRKEIDRLTDRERILVEALAEIKAIDDKYPSTVDGYKEVGNIIQDCIIKLHGIGRQHKKLHFVQRFGCKEFNKQEWKNK